MRNKCVSNCCYIYIYYNTLLQIDPPGFIYANKNHLEMLFGFIKSQYLILQGHYN